MAGQTWLFSWNTNEGTLLYPGRIIRRRSSKMDVLYYDLSQDGLWIMSEIKQPVSTPSGAAYEQGEVLDGKWVGCH